MLAGAVIDHCLCKAIEDLLYLSQRAGKPVGNRPYALATDTSLDNVFAVEDLAHFRNHTTKALHCDAPACLQPTSEQRGLQLGRTAIQNDATSRAKYGALRARGHGHARVVRSVVDRLLYVACAMLENRTLFAPSLPKKETPAA